MVASSPGVSSSATAKDPSGTTETGRSPRCDRHIPASFWSSFVSSMLGKYSAPAAVSPAPNMEDQQWPKQ
jgi:hypothetical protein